MIIDPCRPDIEEWIRSLEPVDRFVMVTACRFTFVRCRDDAWWSVQLKIAGDACDLAGVDRDELVEKAVRVAASMRAELGQTV
jgi:hypothetical protein